MRRKKMILVKKKRHCIKNVLICGQDQKIFYLSQTYCGSVHDKTIADESEIEFQRTVIEHSIRGLKIWRIAKDLCRTWRTELRDYFILIACGLHNFRLSVRSKLKTNSV